MVWNQFLIIVEITFLNNRILLVHLVKCLSLQPYSVTIPTRSSGEYNFAFLYLLILNPGWNILALCSSVYHVFTFLILPLTLLIRQGLRGDHWVLYNYIKAGKEFQVFSMLSHICDYSHNQYALIVILILNHSHGPINPAAFLVQWVYNLHNAWRLWFFG